MTMAGSRRLGCHGTVAVEYALVLSALLIFVFGIVDAGRVLWTRITLERAVETAARCGAVNTATCATAAEIETYAAAQAFGLTIASTAFTSSTAACGALVTATLPFTFVIPWITTSGVTLTATACYPL
jgi:Flp pilus assembly protein TadG